MNYVEEKEDNEKECDVILVCMSVVVVVLYATLMVLGLVYINACDDNRIAVYSVVQGLTVMINCCVFAICVMRKCVSRKVLFVLGLPIFIFNLGWCIQGALWIYTTLCHKTVLYWYAVATSVPLWIIFGVYCFSYWCC